MASGTADLQRDLGGAIMQSIFGALLTAGYAAAAGAAVARRATDVNDQVQTELTKSFASAVDTAAQLPATCRTRSSPRPRPRSSQGDQWAYLAGIVAVLLGAALVFLKFPKRDEEQRLLAAYRAADAAPRLQPAEPVGDEEHRRRGRARRSPWSASRMALLSRRGPRGAAAAGRASARCR